MSPKLKLKLGCGSIITESFIYNRVQSNGSDDKPPQKNDQDSGRTVI